MPTVIAMITAVLSCLNYYWNAGAALSDTVMIAGIAGQGILLVLSIIAMVTYRGKKLRRAYVLNPFLRVWTFRFCIHILSLLATTSTAVVLILNAAGVIDEM